MRPAWDTITKDMWYKAYRIMRKARKKTAFEMIRYDTIIFDELQDTFKDYHARVRHEVCKYFFKEFYKRIGE